MIERKEIPLTHVYEIECGNLSVGVLKRLYLGSFWIRSSNSGQIATFHAYDENLGNIDINSEPIEGHSIVWRLPYKLSSNVKEKLEKLEKELEKLYPLTRLLNETAEMRDKLIDLEDKLNKQLKEG